MPSPGGAPRCCWPRSPRRFLLFPTGTLPSRRWLPVAAAGLLLACLTTAGLIVHPGPVALMAPGGVSVIFPNSLGVTNLGPVLSARLIGTSSGLSTAAAVFLAAALVSLAVRYRAGDHVLRQQVKGLALTAVAFVAGVLIALLGIAAGQAWLTTVAYTTVELLGLLGISVWVSHRLRGGACPAPPPPSRPGVPGWLPD